MEKLKKKRCRSRYCPVEIKIILFEQGEETTELSGNNETKLGNSVYGSIDMHHYDDDDLLDNKWKKITHFIAEHIYSRNAYFKICLWFRCPFYYLYCLADASNFTCALFKDIYDVNKKQWYQQIWWFLYECLPSFVCC